jgi:hypothetical protein
MIVGFNNNYLECVSTKLKLEQDKYFEAMFEDRDKDAVIHQAKIVFLKSLMYKGEEFIPKF